MTSVYFTPIQVKQIKAALQSSRFAKLKNKEKITLSQQLRYSLISFVKCVSAQQKERDQTLQMLQKLLTNQQCLRTDPTYRTINIRQSVEMLQKKLAKYKYQLKKPLKGNETREAKSSISLEMISLINQVTYEEINSETAKELKSYIDKSQAFRQHKQTFTQLINKMEKACDTSRMLQKGNDLGAIQLSQYIKTACIQNVSSRDMETELNKLPQSGKVLMRPLHDEILRLREVLSDFSRNVFREVKKIEVKTIQYQQYQLRQDRQKTIDHLVEQSNKIQKQCQAFSILVRDLASICKQPTKKDKYRQQIYKTINLIDKEQQRVNLTFICDYLWENGFSKQNMISPRNDIKAQQIQAYSQQLEKQKKQVQKIKVQLKTLKEQRARDLQILSRDKQEIQRLKRGIQQLKETIQAKERIIDTLKQYKAQKLQHSPIKNVQAKKQPEIKDIKQTDQKKEVENNLNQYSDKQIEALHKNNERLLSQNDKLKQKLASYSIKQIQAQSISQQTNIRSYKQNQNKMQSSIEILKQSNQALKSQLASIKGQLSQLRDKSRKYEEMIYKLQQRQIQLTRAKTEQLYRQKIAEPEERMTFGRQSGALMSSKRSLQTDEPLKDSPIKLIIKD